MWQLGFITSESLKKTNVSAQFTKSNHDMQRLEVEMQTGSYSLEFSLADLKFSLADLILTWLEFSLADLTWLEFSLAKACQIS